MVVLQRHRLRRRFRANSREHVVSSDVCIHTRRMRRTEWVRTELGKSTQAEATARAKTSRRVGACAAPNPPKPLLSRDSKGVFSSYLPRGTTHRPRHADRALEFTRPHPL